MNAQIAAFHFNQLNWVDYSIIAVLTASILISFIRGFVREVLSLLTWISAFLVAFNFGHQVSLKLAPHVPSQTIQVALAFGALFLGTLLVGAVVNYLLSSLVQKTGLGGTDRVLGMALGGVRGVLIVSLLILLAGFTSITRDPAWQTSTLIPSFQVYSVQLQKFIPDIMDFVTGQ